MVTTEPRRHDSVPKIAENAWHGRIGESVARIAPSTEADPVAVLVSTLALFGAMIGDVPHVVVGGIKHPPRIWPLIIGKTGSGRKGTSWAEARRIAGTWGSYAEEYLGHRVVGGLSSGEGLIGALSGEDDDGSGVADGRLTIVETEFARVLTAAKREGSTLGPVLRQLWDDGSAAILTKQPVRVNDTHPIIVAHVTPRELRLRLAESDLAGGTMNRYLPVLSERPHLLAHDPGRADITDLGVKLGDRMNSQRFAKEIRRDKSTDDLWTQAYAALSEDEPDGPLGAVLARGPAYVMRLALVYALADGADVIRSAHMLAALAVWDYAVATARTVFADMAPKTNLGKLAEFVRPAPAGRSRTEITSKCFGGNLPSAEIDALVAELVESGLVEVRVDKPAKGKPTKRCHWIAGDNTSAVAELLTARTNELTKDAL